MSSISSDEIISILKNEIENFDQISKDSEVGTVVSVGDGIANIYGIEHAMYGVAPAVLCYCFGMRGVIGVAILMFYVLAGLIRLAWFNVMEEQRQEETAEKRECYQGLPITSMAIALPLVVVLKPFLGCEFMLAIHVVMLVVGILFITNFKFRKPKNLTMGAIVVIVAMAVIGILVRHYMRYMSMI